METLGSLVDKLTIVNLKMWHTQEDVYKIRNMSIEEFEEKYSGNIKELYKVLNKATNLNLQRNTLIDEIDSYFKYVMSGEIDNSKICDPKNKVY